MDPTWQAFRPDLWGTFIDRPNRFVVRVDVGTVVSAHCPNPGRLAELLFPGTPVILERAAGIRKLGYTLVAVERPGVTVPMVSVRANEAVRTLVLPRLFPSASAICPEFTLEASRFDFLVEENGVRHLVEVKACSEVEFDTALFPDAPSDRARKHLEELTYWGDRSYRPHVVFAVVHGRPRVWRPNIHTDPAFARTLGTLAPSLNLHAVVFETTPDGVTRLVETDLPLEILDPGPDSGNLIRVAAPGEPGSQWTIDVEWYPANFERAVAKAPARTSFPLRTTVDRSQEIRDALGPEGSSDPRLDPGFWGQVMGWRHR